MEQWSQCPYSVLSTTGLVQRKRFQVKGFGQKGGKLGGNDKFTVCLLGRACELIRFGSYSGPVCPFMRTTATPLMTFCIVPSKPDRGHIEPPTQGDLEADSYTGIDQKIRAEFDCDTKARTRVLVLARVFRIYMDFD